MSHFRSFGSAACAAGLATLLLLACGGGGSGASMNGGTGSVNLALTDAPSDTWQQVTVQLKSASLRTQGTATWTQVWTADPANPATGAVNLVDLSSVADLLAKATVPAGSYDRLQLVLNTDPTTMTLVDDSGATLPAADLTVVDPGGKGELNVIIDPVLQVTSGATASLQVDFDLAHPLSIVQETIGGVQKVVLNLQVRHKALPARIQDLQFARKLGKVTALAASGFTLTDGRGATFTYGVDANTIYQDVDAKAPGTFAGLTTDKFALVASNLNADGSLYARRVWYAAAAASLPAWTPEGLVRRVDLAMNTFTVYNKTVTPTALCRNWGGQLVTVDANTVWTFHDTVAMGTGTGLLKDIWRGTRVDVTLDTTGKLAKTVNVSNAHDEGFISSTSATGLTFGWAGGPTPAAAGIAFGPTDMGGRTWTFYNNPADTANAFSWWYYGLPSGASKVITDLNATVSAAQTMRLPVTGYCALYWDTVSNGWQAWQLILDPERLNTSVITTGYADTTAGMGTMAVEFLTPVPMASPVFAPMTITLDYAGDLQTVVEAITWNSTTRLLTFQVPVDHSQWATLLVPPAGSGLSGTRIWVRPVLNGADVAWHAYNIEVFNVTP